MVNLNHGLFNTNQLHKLWIEGGVFPLTIAKIDQFHMPWQAMVNLKWQ